VGTVARVARDGLESRGDVMERTRCAFNTGSTARMSQADVAPLAVTRLRALATSTKRAVAARVSAKSRKFLFKRLHGNALSRVNVTLDVICKRTKWWVRARSYLASALLAHGAGFLVSTRGTRMFGREKSRLVDAPLSVWEWSKACSFEGRSVRE